MGKKITTNPKSIEARERKDAKKRAENERKEKEKDDALWADDDKLVNRKLNRKEEKEKKKQDELIKKQENKQLYEEELKSLKSAKQPANAIKVTRAQIERTLEKEKLEKEKLAKLDEKNEENLILEENINRLQPEIVVASGVDDAIKALSLNDNEKLERHPEKRMKAAYTAFEEEQLPILKKQNPTLRLSQLKQILKKEWMKSPENPLNQAFKAYNTK